jgi:hypothetical protein
MNSCRVSRTTGGQSPPFLERRYHFTSAAKDAASSRHTSEMILTGEKIMTKILKLTDDQIDKLTIDREIKYVLKKGLESNKQIKGIFKWDVQAWAVTINDKKVPVKTSASSIFTVRYDEVVK